MSNLRRIVGLAGLALSASGVAQTTQTSPGGGAGLEEVVVTAQKRTENVQSVPLSMTTFTSKALEEKSIATFVDYATKIPNLAFAPTGDGVGTARTVSIRGIAGNGTTSFYIDDTPLPDSIDPRVLDIDHIEVLRGPQGSLYGARSMGGLVKMITKTPELSEFTADFHAGISDTARTSRENWTGDGVINIPLIKDTVALRISAFYDDQAGYFTRSYCTNPATAGVSCFPLSANGTTTVKNVGEIDTYGGAAALTIKLGDDVTVTPRIMTQRADYNGFPMADILSMPGNGYGYPVSSGPYTLPTPLLPTNFNQARLFNVPEGGSDSWDLMSLTAKWKTAIGEFVSSTSYFDRRVYETEDESDFVWAAITSTVPGGTAQPGAISELKNYQQFTQEIRFASSLSGPVQFVAGGYYSDLHGRLPFAAYYPPATVPGLDATLGGVNNSAGIANLIFAQDFKTDVKESAVFGEVSFQPIDAVKLTAGARVYTVKSSSEGYEEGLATGLFDTTISPSASVSNSGVSPKFEADWHLTPDAMVYTNIAKGFRPSGVVPVVPNGVPGTATDCVAALAAQDPNAKLADTRSYKSDTLWNYEIGAKTSWLDHRVTMNGALFDIRWKNIQQPELLSCGFQFIANAGAAESKGAEFEMHARATEALELGVGVGYQDAKITQGGPLVATPPGSPVQQVPDWTGNASALYTVPVTSEWDFQGGADWSYIGRSFSANNDPANPRERPAYRLVDARLALTKHRLEIAVVGKNLTNEAANLGDSRSIAAEVPGRPRIFVNQPRTVGLEFREHF